MSYRRMKSQFRNFAQENPYKREYIEDNEAQLNAYYMDPRQTRGLRTPVNTKKMIDDFEKVRKAAGNSPLYDKLKLDFRDLVPKLEQDEEIIEQNRFKEFVENTFLDGENIDWFRRSGNYKWDKYVELFPEYTEKLMNRVKTTIQINVMLAKIMVRGRIETREEAALLYLLQQESDETGASNRMFSDDSQRRKNFEGTVPFIARTRGRPKSPLQNMIHEKLIMQLLGAYGWTEEQLEDFEFNGFEYDDTGFLKGFFDFRNWGDMFKGDFKLKVLTDHERAANREHARMKPENKAKIRAMNYLNNLPFLVGFVSAENAPVIKEREEMFRDSHFKSKEGDISLFMPEVNRLRTLQNPVQKDRYFGTLHGDNTQETNKHNILDSLFW